MKLECPHCDEQVGRVSTNGAKVKIPTRILVLHKSGKVELNCPSCKQGILIPVSISNAGLRKAVFTARKGLTAPSTG